MVDVAQEAEALLAAVSGIVVFGVDIVVMVVTAVMVNVLHEEVRVAVVCDAVILAKWL